MRKLLVCSFVAAWVSGGVLASTAYAGTTLTQPTDPDNSPTPVAPACYTSATSPGAGGITADQITTWDGQSGVQVCQENSSLPLTGTITVAGSEGSPPSSAPSGYIVADGNPGNPSPGGGYIGVAGGSNGVAVVGCDQGNYDPNGAATYSTTTNPDGSTTRTPNANYPYENNTVLGVDSSGNVTNNVNGTTSCPSILPVPVP